MGGGDASRRTVRVRIEGLVQGVGFRVWVERTARRIGLDGWVRNRRDGGVEAVLSGEPQLVEAMIGRCHQGPPASSVQFVKVLEETELPAPGFQVLPTV